MKSNKVLLGVLAGVAAGALIGVLLSSEKGAKIRKQFNNLSDDYAEELKNKFNKLTDSGSTTVEKDQMSADKIAARVNSISNEVKKNLIQSVV